jgi:hypothetical protein
MTSDLDILKTIKHSFLSVVENDSVLLKITANERSVTHRLAVYLERQFEGTGFQVDCEYNRDRRKPKRLKEFKRKISSDNTKGVTVYPDIIVHKRDTDENLIVIEAKFERSSLDCNQLDSCICDRCKLRAYKNDLGYSYAFFIRFPTGNSLVNLDADCLDAFIEPIADEE